MHENDRPFSCAETVVKEIAKMKRLFAFLVLLCILSNVATALLTTFFINNKVFFTYFKTTEALEKIHNVQIKYGDVSPLPQE